ncbi:MAG: GNAT family protein [Bacteroidales bacterium]
MLSGKNLSLRALEPSDVDLLYKWENDEEVWHLSNTITPFSRFTLEQYIMNSHQDIYTNKQLRLMIDLLEAGSPQKSIGAIDLFDFDPANMRSGIGILIVKEEREKGYASGALDLLIDYAFNRIGLHQLYCNILKGHSMSLDLFRKKNFEVIGIKKEWIRIGDKWEDEYLLQLLHKNFMR